MVIDLGAAAGHAAGADVLTLAGIGLSDLGASDFVFGKGAHAAGAQSASHAAPGPSLADLVAQPDAAHQPVG